MNYTVYILLSEHKDKSYVGYSADINRRIWEHNNSPEKSYTSRFRPWKVIYTESFHSKSEALAREKWFKTGVGREHKARILAEFLQNQ